ncbi:DNA binding domain protein, excisionase family [Coriobacteriaceae bacterium BV3Ac1]|nr:DNA binding domain protein, excisionase family [Coriobacteriaceae bacterium BV3Ac1]
MADEIFKLERTTVRGADAADADLSDNGCVDRENAEAENRGFAAFSTSDASDQVDTLLDVSQVAEYLRISWSSVYKLIERQQIPAIRIGRLLRVRKNQLEDTLRAMVHRLNLLVPVGSEHMWNAAMESGGCRLTMLGEHAV